MDMIDPVQPNFERAAARLAVGYALRTLHRAARAVDGDILDGAIRVAIGDANVRYMSEDPLLSGAYADLEQPLPVEMRRPVSINAIATSLNLPFETTRRRIAALIARGQCDQGPRGVWTTPQGASSPRQLEIIVENFEDLGGLRRDLLLSAPGALVEPADVRGAAEGAFSGAPPYRAAIRASMAFMLRFIEPMGALTGDLLDGVILLTIGQKNSARFAASPELARRYGSADTPIPESELDAASVKELSRTLDLPFETTRRRVRALEAKGMCVRRRGGVCVSADMMVSPEMRRVMSSTSGDLQRLYNSLWRLGVRLD